MKGNLFKKVLFLLLCLLGGTNLMFSATPVDIPTASGSFMDWRNADLTNAKSENDGANVGSTGGSTVITFSINNTTEQAYVLTFATGNKNNSAKVHVQLTASDETVVIDNWTVTSEKTGAWTPTTPHNPSQVSRVWTKISASPARATVVWRPRATPSSSTTSVPTTSTSVSSDRTSTLTHDLFT